MKLLFQPGERVQVIFETEVICQLPDGRVLLRMVGIPLPISAISSMTLEAVKPEVSKNDTP